MINIETNFNSDVNLSFEKFFQCSDPEVVLYGGAAAGKSYAIAQRLIVKVLYYDNRKIIVSRKTFPSLKLTALDMIKNLLETYHIPYRENKQSPYTIYVGNSQFIFLSFVNTLGEEAERIKSMTDVTDWWVEETTEVTEEEYTQAHLRLRGQPLEKGTRQMFTSFNPVNEMHWLNNHFFKNNVGTKFKYTYKDNKFLDDGSIKTIEDLEFLNPNMWRVYGLGEWGTLGELIYSNYIIEDFEIKEFNNPFAGTDFGYNHPSTWILMEERDDEIYITDEIYQTKLLNKGFIDLIKVKQDFWKVKPMTYPDTAEPDRIEEMRINGIKIGNTDKSLERIDFIQGKKLHIHPRCVNTIKEIRGYSFRKNSNGQVLDEPVKFMDHLMDAMGYGIYNHIKTGNTMAVPKPKGF